MDMDALDKLFGFVQRHGPLGTLLAAALLWAWDERKQRVYLQTKLLKLTAVAFARSRLDE
jgi:hypothetical protein